MNKNEVRHCLNCKQEFIVKNPSNRKKKRLFCNKCIAELTNNQKRQLKLQYDPEYKEHFLQGKKNSYRKNIVHTIWKRAKSRALKNNLEFNIEESDIIIPDICPLLEIPIILGDKNNYENTPSLDRIDNSKGYIKGNIWVISKKANSMKNSATFKELSTFCKNIRRYSLNTFEYEESELKDKEPLG